MVAMTTISMGQATRPACGRMVLSQARLFAVRWGSLPLAAGLRDEPYGMWHLQSVPLTIDISQFERAL
jgi:hypothetical protein